ncbi:hypothetical protein HK101_007394 [Irineochytrium annulatum]|nr:hypothetical protein HK101_007394 [Irineochytrium annulatum]
MDADLDAVDKLYDFGDAAVGDRGVAEEVDEVRVGRGGEEGVESAIGVAREGVRRDCREATDLRGGDGAVGSLTFGHACCFPVVATSLSTLSTFPGSAVWCPRSVNHVDPEFKLSIDDRVDGSGDGPASPCIGGKGKWPAFEFDGSGGVASGSDELPRLNDESALTGLEARGVVGVSSECSIIVSDLLRKVGEAGRNDEVL